MALHLKQWFGPTNPKEGNGLTGFEEPASWDRVPLCVLTAVEQLRQVLVCPETGERLLDEFGLGFAQFTRSAHRRGHRSNHPPSPTVSLLLTSRPVAAPTRTHTG